ncbi:MAG TPA: CAP domain-containing protein [Eubacteriales bacterium]|nr:CAP domain-containing protein [Clostridia bacterium]HRR89476.1 CAP domain-containing protein [Eubacteriales bacterium]HRU84585.1 CAP domain-containing protein [Eubacteriales bacterium]
MKKLTKIFIFALLVCAFSLAAFSALTGAISPIGQAFAGADNPPEFEEGAFAATTYKVQPGDSMWKIAVRFEIGLSELIKANPQIKNAALIYVGQVINIPEGAPLKSLEDEVVRLVNIERSRNGLGPLKNNWQAARVARIKSQDMINNRYFSHTSPAYGSPFKMMESFGLRFSSAGENIAYGQRTAQEVMNSWMNSAGHRANILSKNYTDIGVGAAKSSNGTLYWTQMFLKPI